MTVPSPMLASLIDASLVDPELVYEPKYDGIRAIAEVPARGKGIRLWSRLGNEKTRQFPEVVAALAQWAKRRTSPAVLDGEVVALDSEGRPAGFQQLQNRIHLHEAPAHGYTAYIVFDLLREGTRDLRERPLTERRAALEKLLARPGSTTVRVSEMVRGDARELYDRALASGWEGLIAKQKDSRYQSGKRTPDWRKLKILQEQEFVVGGWTDPRQTRSYFGALLLGVYESGKFTYVGHTGTGFNERELARLMKLLRPLEQSSSPFAERIKTNERPHWVKPELVAQVRFTEWTADNKLRHPVYLGLRDDKKADEVVRESRKAKLRVDTPRKGGRAVDYQGVLDQLTAIEQGSGTGVLTLPDGERLDVTNLKKVFWPDGKLTKGDLFRYYVHAAPYILPAIDDRPLVMKRFPNGVAAKPFFQHRVDLKVPAGVRVEPVPGDEKRPQLIGGHLMTLLYMTQLASISQDPWFSRVKTIQYVDYVAIDLDPSDGVPFSQVLDVARWVHDELDRVGAAGVPKTSGSRGLHVYLPLPPKTTYEAGLIFCQIVATMVATRHPKQATVERSVNARGQRVYVDYLQNIMGKTLATAYSARASNYAGVSTPLTWNEIDQGIDREDFTIRTVPDRLKKVGDLWAALRNSKGIDLEAVARATHKTSGRARR